MGDLLEFKTAGGEAVLVEVAETSGPVTRGGRGEAVISAGESLEHILGRLGPTVHGIVEHLRSAPSAPDEVEVEFGVKLSADSNVIISRVGGEANFRIALKWSDPGREPGVRT